MKTLNLVQGSDEWKAVRGKYHSSSNAAIVMGDGRITRQQLLRQKATGDSVEYSRWVEEVLFERGHEAEAQARPLAEAHIGEDLYPVTGITDDDWLLSSFDGLTMGQDVCWESKLWSITKAADVAQGFVPALDFWQCIHHLLVSGADRCVYTLSDGTPENTVHTDLMASDIKIATAMANLLIAYRQFDEDLAEYVPEAAPVEVMGRAPDQLPALLVEVTGMVKSSNLRAYEEHARSVLSSINRTLETDEDFANAAKTVVWCEKVEKALEAKKADILGQTATIDEVFRVMDSLKAETRTVRLELDKLVESRKKSIRVEIVNSVTAAFRKHLDEVNAGLPNWATISAAEIAVDFPGAMKGKKNITSLNDAVAQALAEAKIDISKIAMQIYHNLKLVNPNDYLATGHRDLATLIRQPHYQEVAEARITAFKAEQQRKEDEQRERIRAEEEAKAQREKDAAIEAEKRRLQAEADEAARIAREEERKRNTETMVQGQEAAKQNPAGLDFSGKKWPDSPPTPALETNQVVTFETDLARWADVYGVSDYALSQLYAILQKYNVSLEAA